MYWGVGVWDDVWGVRDRTRKIKPLTQLANANFAKAIPVCGGSSGKPAKKVIAACFSETTIAYATDRGVQVTFVCSSILFHI